MAPERGVPKMGAGVEVNTESQKAVKKSGLRAGRR